MKIAVAGLGRMGMQIAHSLVRDGHEVLAQNRSPEKVDQAVSFGATAAYKAEDVAAAFGGEQAIVWLMVPAEVVEEELDAWLKVLKPGDIIVDGDDIYGDGVNVAARIQMLANPGGIYISRSAAEQVRDKVPIKIETRGEQTVKNIAKPVRVYRVLLNGTVLPQGTRRIPRPRPATLPGARPRAGPGPQSSRAQMRSAKLAPA